MDCLKQIPSKQKFLESIEYDKDTCLHFPKVKPNERGKFKLQSVESVHAVCCDNAKRIMDPDLPYGGPSTSCTTDSTQDFMMNVTYNASHEKSAFRTLNGKPTSQEVFVSQKLTMRPGDTTVQYNQRIPPTWTQDEDGARFLSLDFVHSCTRNMQERYTTMFWSMIRKAKGNLWMPFLHGLLSCYHARL